MNCLLVLSLKIALSQEEEGRQRLGRIVKPGLPGMGRASEKERGKRQKKKTQLNMSTFEETLLSEVRQVDCSP